MATAELLARPAPGAAAVAARAADIRKQIIRVIARVGEGYLLQGLGAADILAALYFSELRLDPGRPGDPDQDRCLLCTAHNSVALYSTLALRGFFPVADLDHYCEDGSPLEMISSERVAGVEGTFGSLGQGLSVAVGMALSNRRRGKDWRVYPVLGDGEMQEGQTWEAAMAAAAYRVDNLCLVIDLNGMQVEGAISSVLPLGPVAAKWQAFGWSVQEVDGHDPAALLDALAAARSVTGQPSVIIAATCPGHPISFLRGRLEHYAKLSADQGTAALLELDEVGR